MGLNFLRRDAARYFKFGKGRGKKATWKAPKGRDNKMREKRRGYPAVVSIGYKKPISEEKIVEIANVNDLNKLKKGEVGLIKSIGKKKKTEIVEKAKEMRIKLKNVNPEKYLEKENKEKKDELKN